MTKLIDREPSADTIYPVVIPGHISKSPSCRGEFVVLYFTAKQLKALRANVAKAILKANGERK